MRRRASSFVGLGKKARRRVLTFSKLQAGDGFTGSDDGFEGFVSLDCAHNRDPNRGTGRSKMRGFFAALRMTGGKELCAYFRDGTLGLMGDRIISTRASLGRRATRR